MARVSFARINRRTENETLDLRPFGEDLRRLAESQETRSWVRQREWIAADLKTDPSEQYMTGTLGYKERGVHLDFDESSFSWIKAQRSVETITQARNVVPFAVDLRDDRRWVAHAVSGQINATTFASGLEAVITAAAAAADLVPVDWEVDPFTSKVSVEAWVRRHPEVRMFTRKIKRSNPGRDLTDDLAEMKALGARTKHETFTAGYKSNLQLLTPDQERLREIVLDKLDGLEKGDIEVVLEARGNNKATYRFSSRDSSDAAFVEDYDDDLELGIELVLGVLSLFSEQQTGGSGSPSLDLSY